MSEPNFVNGMRVSRRQNAPVFVIANLGIKVDEFIKWLRENQDGEWTNIDIKLSKGGKYYAELNAYKKEGEVKQEKKEEPVVEYPEEETISESDIPF